MLLPNLNCLKYSKENWLCEERVQCFGFVKPVSRGTSDNIGSKSTYWPIENSYYDLLAPYFVLLEHLSL